MRVAKLQDRVKKRELITGIVAVIIVGYMLMCGWYSFRGHIDSSGMYYLGISLAVILVAVFLKERLIGADPNRENADKRIYNIIGFGSMAYSFIMMIIVTGIFNNHEIQSWKIDGNIGRIINVQLIIIFITIAAMIIIYLLKLCISVNVCNSHEYIILVKHAPIRLYSLPVSPSYFRMLT